MPDTTCSKCGTQWGGNYASLICPICHHDAEVDRLKAEVVRLRDELAEARKTIHERDGEIIGWRERIHMLEGEVERLRKALSQKEVLCDCCSERMVNMLEFVGEAVKHPQGNHPWLEDE